MGINWGNITMFRRAVVMTALLICALGFRVQAVTDKEMEQARTTAALWYLRYANDGSDYLEKLSPSTLPELEKSLKQKEKENIKAFKAVGVPSDYASWDKQKLVEYWSVTFFKSKGLAEKGVIARSRVKKKIEAMTVSAPAPEKSEEAPAQQAAAPEATPADASAPEAIQAPAEPALAEGKEIVEQADSMATVSFDDASAAERKKRSSGTTWIYVVALVALVGVVVWLVIFASKTMQGNSAKPAENPDDEEDAKAPGASAPQQEAIAPRRENARRVRLEPTHEEAEAEADVEAVATRAPESAERGLREKFARTLAGKDEEIRVLQREIHDLREECLKLGEENGRLSGDLTLAQRELEALRGRLRAASAVTSVASAAPAPSSRQPERTASPAATKAQAREIYLGRVNAKGIFVCADRQPAAGKSVFVLTTSDGYTGSFRVIQTTEVISRVLDNPELYLAGGCVADDIADTETAEGINTLASGTAVFEDRCWRMVRKTKIEYI